MSQNAQAANAIASRIASLFDGASVSIQAADGTVLGTSAFANPAYGSAGSTEPGLAEVNGLPLAIENSGEVGTAEKAVIECVVDGKTLRFEREVGTPGSGKEIILSSLAFDGVAARQITGMNLRVSGYASELDKAHSVEITSPLDGAAFTENQNVSIAFEVTEGDTAKASSALVQYENSEGGFQNIGTVPLSGSGSYSTSWTAVVGAQGIRVRVRDASSSTLAQDAIAVSVTASENTAPVVTITNVTTTSGGGPVSVTATIVDAEGALVAPVASDAVMNGGIGAANSVTSLGSNSFRFDWTNVTVGTYQVAISASDGQLAGQDTAVVEVMEAAGYLLDTYTPVVYHSLTKDKSDYDGPVLRARRGDAITAVSGSQVTITGTEAASVYENGDAVSISGSTGNDAAYTVSGAPVVSGDNTIITLSSPLPDATADGMLVLDRDIPFSGDFVDESALTDLFDGCTEGRLERIYAQVDGQPDAIAPSYAESPYLCVNGELTRWANGHVAPWFDKGCDLVVTGHGSVTRHAQTFFVVMQGGKPDQGTDIFRVGGVTLKLGHNINMTLTNGSDGNSSRPYCIQRPLVASSRASATELEFFRNYNKKFFHTVTAADTSTTNTIIGTSAPSQGCFYAVGWCVFDSTLSDQDREAVYEHLARRWRCGPLRKVEAPVASWLTDFEEGVELLDFLQSLTIEDVEIDPSTKVFDWDGGGDWTGRLDELATLRALWDSGEMRAGHDSLSEARWYVAEDGPDGETVLPILDECTIESAAPDIPSPGILQVYEAGGVYKEAFIKLDLSVLMARPAVATALYYLLEDTAGDANQAYVGVEYAFDVDWDGATATWNNPPLPVKNGNNSYNYALGITEGQVEAEVEDMSNTLIEAYDAGATTLTIHLWMARGTNRELTFHSSIDPNPLSVTVSYKAGIFGTGAVRIPYRDENTHHYLLGTAGAALYNTSLPNSDGSEANPYYKDPALGRRSLAFACIWATMWWQGVDGSLYYAQGWASAKVPRLLAAIYYQTKDLLTDAQKKAFKRAIAAYLSFVADKPNDGTLTNMEMMGVEGAGLAYAACDEGTQDDIAVRIAARKAVRNILFGQPYGGTVKNSTFRRNYYTTGFVGENNGPDPSYGGYSQTHTVACRLLTYGDPEWDFLDEVIDGMYRFKAYNYAPNPYGSYWGMGAAWASRTGDDMTHQLDQHHWVNCSAAFLSEHARPFFPAADADASQMVSQIQSSLNSLMATSAEKSFQSGGWDGTLYKGLPPVYKNSSLWPDPYNLVPDPSTGWFTTLQALYASNDPTTILPLEKGDHNVAHGDEDAFPGPEFWSYAGTDENDRRFAFLVCAFNRPYNSSEVDHPGYEGWHGAHVSAFWTPETGNIIDNRHGKTGGQNDGDPAYEDNKRWSIADKWAYDGVLGFASYPVVAVSGNEVRISGDKSLLFKAGTGHWVAEANNNSLGTRTVSAVSYDSVNDQTVLTFSDASKIAVGCKVVWGFTTAFGAQDGQVSVFDIDGATPRVVATAEISGTKRNLSLAGTGEVQGVVTVETEITATDSGYSKKYVITPDAVAMAGDYFPTLDAVIPVLLNDPDQSSEEATIEFDDGGWAIASTSPVITRYIRIGRGGSYVYITLPEEKPVFLSPDVYVQPYQDNKRLRNIVIDCHPDRGTPSLLPASTTIEYSVSTVDTTGVEGVAMSVSLLDPAMNLTVPAGEVAGIHWQVQGGEAPYTHVVEISTDGGDTFSPLAGTLQMREIVAGEFEALGGAWPSGSFKVRVAVTDAGATTKYTLAHDVVGATLEQIFFDTFTDAPGTAIADHTPEMGDYATAWVNGPPRISDDGTFLAYGEGTYQQIRVPTVHNQLVDVRVKGRGAAPGSAWPAAALRARIDSNANAVARVGWVNDSLMVSLYQSSSGNVSLPGFATYDGVSWFRVRAYAAGDSILGSVYDESETLVGHVASWSLGSSHNSNNYRGAGVVLWSSGGIHESVGADDLKIYTF